MGTPRGDDQRSPAAKKKSDARQDARRGNRAQAKQTQRAGGNRLGVPAAGTTNGQNRRPDRPTSAVPTRPDRPTSAVPNQRPQGFGPKPPAPGAPAPLARQGPSNPNFDATSNSKQAQQGGAELLAQLDELRENMDKALGKTNAWARPGGGGISGGVAAPPVRKPVQPPARGW